MGVGHHLGVKAGHKCERGLGEGVEAEVARPPAQSSVRVCNAHLHPTFIRLKASMTK